MHYIIIPLVPPGVQRSCKNCMFVVDEPGGESFASILVSNNLFCKMIMKYG